MRIFLLFFLILSLTSCANTNKSEIEKKNERKEEIPMNVTMETTININ